MARKKPQPTQSNPSLAPRRIDPTVLAAIIGATALIVSAVITYMANRTQAEIPIQATQTAEARLTGVPSPTMEIPFTTTAPAENKLVPITIENVKQLELLKEIDLKASHGKVLFSPDDKLVAYGRYDESTRIWNTSDYSFVRKLENAGKPILFSADGTTLYTVLDRDLKVWDLSSGEYKGILHSADGIAISPDETRVALCDAQNQKVEIRPLTENYTYFTLDIKLEMTGGDSLRCVVQFSQDGSILMVSDGIFFSAYDMHNWTMIERFEGVNLSTTEFSPDGKYFADGWYLFNTSDWSVRFEFPTPDIVYMVTFTTDGTMAVTGSQDSSVQFWNVKDGSLVKMIKGSNVYPPMAGLAFSNSGNLLVVVTDKIRFYGIE